MVLKPLRGQSGKFYDTKTGVIIDVREFFPCEFFAPFTGSTSKPLEPPKGEDWALQSWAVLVEPMRDTFPRDILVELLLHGETIAEAPLYSVAEKPLGTEYADLIKRIEAIEKRLKLGPVENHIKKLREKPVVHGKKVIARLKDEEGGSVTLTGKNELILRGYRRCPVVHGE